MLDCITPHMFFTGEKMFYIQLGSNPIKTITIYTRLDFNIYIYTYLPVKLLGDHPPFSRPVASGTIVGALQDHSNSLGRGGFRIGAARLGGC